MDVGELTVSEVSSEVPSEVPKYPGIEVVLPDEDFGTFYVIGLVAQALSRAHVPDSEIMDFCEQASSDDLNHVIYTAYRWVSVG